MIKQILFEIIKNKLKENNFLLLLIKFKPLLLIFNSELF